jgi:hypothetical protein
MTYGFGLSAWTYDLWLTTYYTLFIVFRKVFFFCGALLTANSYRPTAFLLPGKDMKKNLYKYLAETAGFWK